MKSKKPLEHSQDFVDKLKKYYDNNNFDSAVELIQSTIEQSLTGDGPARAALYQAADKNYLNKNKTISRTIEDIVLQIIRSTTNIPLPQSGHIAQKINIDDALKSNEHGLKIVSDLATIEAGGQRTWSHIYKTLNNNKAFKRNKQISLIMPESVKDKNKRTRQRG